MQLDGHLLHRWQSGRRRYAIERHYRLRRFHPKVLFSLCMSRAIYALSNSAPLDSTTITAVNRFIANARTPGLDVPRGTNTYTLAMDYCAVIRTVLDYLHRTTLLSLHEKSATVIDPASNLSWRFLAYEDDSGQLHRWSFVDYIDIDEITRQGHSWEVVGDAVVAKAPMTLHLVSIGQVRNNRRNSPWCRAFKSPAIAGMFKFQRRDGTPVTDNWKPIYFADNTASNASAWVDAMLADNAVEPLIRHIPLTEPSPAHAQNFLRDVMYEHAQILASGVESDHFNPMSLPMCRAACDTPYTCPHQNVCYDLETTLETCGLYDKISPRSKVQEVRKVQEMQNV